MKKIVSLILFTLTVILPLKGQITVRAENMSKPELVYLKVFNDDNSIDNYVRTGDLAHVELKSNIELVSAQILREGKLYKELKSIEDKSIWKGELLIDEVEGFDYLIIQLRDTNNNVNVINPADYFHSELSKYAVKIDNTLPNIPVIDTSKWSTKWELGGVNANGINPEINRFSNNHVLKNDSINLNGAIEREQRVEVYVNDTLVETVNSGDNCILKDESLVTKDNLVVKYGDYCGFNYQFKFPDTGNNKESGEPIYLYKIKVRTLDKAGNRSEYISFPEVFHDSTSPIIR